MKTKLPVILAVEHVRSSHNIGSLFRTSDAANIQKIILSPFCPTPPRTEINKTALGAEKTVEWEQATNFKESLIDLQREGYSLVALEQTPKATDLYQTELPFPLLLIIGHEREGVSEEILGLCDFHIQLPMQGISAHSLNVSNATAITLYEFGRRIWYHTDI